jgi:hypothetical protein
MTRKNAYMLASGAAVVSALMLVWIGLGVGIIGADGDPANLIYLGVIAVGIVGSIIARLKPLGMAWTMLAMSVSQALVAAVALIGRLGLPWSPPLEILVLNGFFVVLFAGSGWLFQQAAQAQPEAQPERDRA